MPPPRRHGGSEELSRLPDVTIPYPPHASNPVPRWSQLPRASVPSRRIAYNPKENADGDLPTYRHLPIVADMGTDIRTDSDQGTADIGTDIGTDIGSGLTDIGTDLGPT